MPASAPEAVTDILRAWSNGDQTALDRLLPLVYDDLRRLARQQMRHERPGHTLQVTALINEAYLRLAAAKGVRWQSREHFFAVSARAMRRILVEYARSRQAHKRGGHLRRITLDDAVQFSADRSDTLVALDDALITLSKMDPRKSTMLELRFFGGLSVDETAGLLNVSPETVFRECRLAKAWLTRELRRGVRDAT